MAILSNSVELDERKVNGVIEFIEYKFVRLGPFLAALDAAVAQELCRNRNGGSGRDLLKAQSCFSTKFIIEYYIFTKTLDFSKMTQSYDSRDVFRPFYAIARFVPKTGYEVSEVTGFGSVHQLEPVSLLAGCEQPHHSSSFSIYFYHLL